MMMTTQGGIKLDHGLAMTDAERLRWLQRCIDYNDELEEKFGDDKRGQTEDRF